MQAEHNYKHTSIIHSHDVEHMTAMARALDTTLVHQERPVHGGAGLGRRRLFELLDRHADGRRRHESADLHPRPPVRDGGQSRGFIEPRIIIYYMLLPALKAMYVATRKHPSFEGWRLVICQPIDEAGKPEALPRSPSIRTARGLHQRSSFPRTVWRRAKRWATKEAPPAG